MPLFSSSKPASATITDATLPSTPKPIGIGTSEIELKELDVLTTPTASTSADTPRSSSSSRKPRVSIGGVPTKRSTEAVYRNHEPSYKYKPWCDYKEYVEIPAVDTTQPTVELADLQEGELSFLKMLFRKQDTVLPEIVTQFVFQILLVLAISLFLTHKGLDTLDMPSDASDLHKVIGSITGFLLVFRTNLAVS